MSAAMSCGFALEEIVLLDHEVVHKLDSEVGLRLDVVLHVDHAVDLDVDCEAVWCELGTDLLVYFNKHVMTALNDRLLGLLLTDTIR